MNKHLLKFKIGPKKYRSIPVGRFLSHAPEEYWQVLPTYTISRCPICHSKFVAQLDTYSLTKWIGATSGGQTLFDSRYQDVGCEHFVLVHYFLNLNNVAPTDTRYLENNSEVPYIPPTLLGGVPSVHDVDSPSDSITTYGVMHALPICRLEENEFLPDYSLHIITYYADDAEKIRRAYNRTLHWEEGFPYPLRDDKESEIWWDLNYWVEQDKLWWLDAHHPDLPLLHHPDPFPYNNIEGIRHGMIYRDGKGKKMPDVIFIDGEAYISIE